MAISFNDVVSRGQHPLIEVCARAASGHATIPPASLRTSRRFMLRHPSPKERHRTAPNAFAKEDVRVGSC
jgi:hypothetical protein